MNRAQSFRGRVSVSRSERITVRDGKSKTYRIEKRPDEIVTVDLRVDVDALLRDLGRKADRSRNKSATAMGGALRATLPAFPR